MKAHRAPKAKEVLEKFYCWFDYSQLIDLIVMKLRYDAENYREYNVSMDADVIAEQMIECTNYLEECADDMNYIDGDYKEYNALEIFNKQDEDLRHALDIIKNNLYSWWD